MNILELDSYNLADAVKFNDRLNPKIWGADEKMLPKVREQLLKIAADFSEFLGVGDLQLKDITLSGSNAAYTYTPHSDIDLHLVVDLPEADKSEVYRELFDAKKYQYNDMHNIKIGGYDVELYVQNANQPHHSQGIYSVLNNDWTDVPKRRKPDVNDISTQSKYEDLQQRIDVAVKSNDFATMDALAGKIREMRQAGLDAHGEFGPENLAFKMLRSQGKIKELYDARNAAKDQEMSLKERERIKQPVTYGFKTEDAGETWDGVNPTTCMFLNEEDPEPTDEEILKDFIDFCAAELKINQLPTVKLRKDPQWSVVNKTFGRYINDKDLLEVSWGQRHIMDILRTVAHELTHRHQHEREAVPTDAGETGSEYENEANARAGVLMRDYARLHPEFFEAGQVDESASGYIPTKKQAKDPRFSMALTQDIRPGQLGKEANKLKLKTDKQGHPQVAKANGLFEKLSLELAKFKKGQADEDYSADNPPGPEFKPTMPAGTLKVDVSDVYDWYKIGQHISNMKGLGKHDFGQGPPSAIISFGDEDTEHKFIGDLKATGLDVTDIDPKDPKKRPGRTIKTDPTYNVNESEELDEVKMSPSSLKKFADSPAAEGIMVGFEAELIVPDVNTGEDIGEMEPDYEADERCTSIQQVIEFFEYDEYGYGLGRRDAEILQEKLDEVYYEWYDEQMYRDFREEAEDLIKKYMIDEGDWVWDDEVRKQLDMMEITGADQAATMQAGAEAPKFKTTAEQQAYMDEHPEYEKYIEAYTEAEELLDELVDDEVRTQDKIWDRALDEFRDNYDMGDDSEFFSDVGLRYMSDVAERFDVYWPYMNYDGGTGSQDIDSVADDLSEALGMPVIASYSYHGATRKPGQFIIEPDGSLSPDNGEDGGLEIISPPMPIAQAMEKLNQVIEWAQARGCYTNSSTGLHMGVSLPGQNSFAEAEGDAEPAPAAEKPIDFMKLAVFLGDQHVLKEFGRSANSYCNSSLKKMKEKKWSPQQIATAMEKMRGNLINLAYKDLADRSPGRDSINMKDNYVEFRGAGGDYLSRESDEGMDFLENTLLRYVQALAIAGDPTAYRDEYAKKLYKLISPEGDNTLDLFTKFATGEISKEELKNDWARKTLEKDDPGSVGKSNWVVIDKKTGQKVQGQEYNGYTQDEARLRAKEKLGPNVTKVAFDMDYSIEPQNSGRWEVYRDDQGQEEQLEIIDSPTRGAAADQAYDTYTGVIPYKIRPYYGDDVAKPAPTPRAKLAKNIIQRPAEQPQQWTVYDTKTGEVYYDHMGRRSSLEQAMRKMEIDMKLPKGQLAIKPSDTTQPQQPPSDATEQEGTWKIFDVTLRQPVETFQGTWAQAERIAQQYETGEGEHNGHEISVRRA